MKELSVEEKAKRYDEALEVLHKYDGANIMFSQSLKEEMFPELAESEDERIRKALIKSFNEYLEQSEAAWGKDVKFKYVNIKEAIAWLEKQGEQKLWSEEDEQMIGRIRGIVEKYAFSQSAVDVNGDLCEKEYIEADNWLKSLRHQSHWKPSEEQIEALYTYIYNPQYFNSPDPRMELVESVYKDLKKLKDE